MHIAPKIAIIDSNTLACIGMKSLLLSIIDGMEVDTFGSFAELETNHPDRYFHYFVAMNIVLPHLDFFFGASPQNDSHDDVCRSGIKP